MPPSSNPKAEPNPNKDTDPDEMDLDLDPDPAKPTNAQATSSSSKTRTRTRTLATATLSRPPFAYAHLSLASPPAPPATTHPDATAPLDALQVRAYLTAALRQFLGDTGAGMAVDILLVQGASAWVRVPQPDLAAFAAAVTAFSGLPLSSSPQGGDGDRLLLQLRACGDWLGSLIGRDEEGELWTC